MKQIRFNTQNMREKKIVLLFYLIKPNHVKIDYIKNIHIDIN
jgi:hypothetical protein